MVSLFIDRQRRVCDFSSSVSEDNEVITEGYLCISRTLMSLEEVGKIFKDDIYHFIAKVINRLDYKSARSVSDRYVLISKLC